MPRILKPRKKGHSLRLFRLEEGLPSLGSLMDEIDSMMDVLMGREPPPVNARYVEAMMECADAYFARASEITMMIQRAERDGRCTKSSPYVKFRTGELRTFMEMVKRTGDLGSRRITLKQMEAEAARTGRDSRY